MTEPHVCHCKTCDREMGGVIPLKGGVPLREVDRLKAALTDIRQTSLTWAMVCPCDCPACNGMYEAIRGAEPTTSTHSEKT